MITEEGRLFELPPLAEQVELEIHSERVSALIGKYKQQFGEYTHAAALGNKAIYFRQYGELNDEASDDLIETIRAKEIELSHEEYETLLFYHAKAVEQLGELDSPDVQKLLHLRGMFENTVIQYSRFTRGVEISSLNAAGPKQDVQITIPSELEEYTLIESAIATFQLVPYTETDNDKERANRIVKLPSLIALSWLANYFDGRWEPSTGMSPGQYL